jgi:2-dehydropantoate 2-reductase
VRYVVFGAGAIGGVVGARLHQAGAEVVLVTRGPHHDAIVRKGLILERVIDVGRYPVAVDSRCRG